MAKSPRNPFELSLDDDQKKTLGLFLCDQVTDAIAARSTAELEVDYFWQLYEQARTRLGKNAPWADAADLTSYLPSEKVDALHARIMRTIFGSDPISTVEGWGDAANRAPFVEEFHQWKAEEERLQGVMDKLMLQALVEPRGLLEIAEGTELRTQRKTITAKIQTDPVTGGIQYDDAMQPMKAVGADGKFIEAGPNDLGAETVVDSPERIRTGPVYRLLPYRDSVILPGHARDAADIFAYGKRFWRRYGELQDKAAGGIYDKAAVEKMSSTQDREPELALQRANQAIAPQTDARAEKELWELLILLDLNKLFTEKSLSTIKAAEGERWYLCTIHLHSNTLLRCQFDDLERSRFVPVILFPRTDRATEGYSFVGHKLITTAEEHTAWRNMAADRAAMVVQAPIKRLQGALWEPAEQPWGPKAVIDVRSMQEIEPMVVPDFTDPVLKHIQMMESTAERLAGINDVAAGQVTTQTKTLGEVQMATEQSFVRMDLIVRRAQEAVEDIYQIRHAIWKRTLAEQPDGLEPPATLLNSLEGRGVDIDQYLPDKKITAQLLDGAFRFKPHGSVQTADPSARRQQWISFLQILPMLLQQFPMQGQNPITMSRAIWRETLRSFGVENVQAFIGSPANDLQATIMGNVMPMLMGGGGLPGMPPGIQTPPGMPPPPGPPMGPPPMPMAPGNPNAPPA